MAEERGPGECRQSETPRESWLRALDWTVHGSGAKRNARPHSNPIPRERETIAPRWGELGPAMSQEVRIPERGRQIRNVQEIHIFQ